MKLYALVDCPVRGDASGDVNIQSQSQKYPKLSDEVPSKQRVGYTNTITQLEASISILKEKHRSQYDAERYACWAHTIQSGKHTSYDDPPDLPSFSCKKKTGN